jgi:hydrogenase maturation protease
MYETRILILGLGSILMQDEGVGVRVVETLQNGYTFAPNVTVMDGGTLGLRLMNPILDAEHLIVVDAVRRGEPPGTVCRLSIEELRTTVKEKQSLHQVDFLETLHYVKMIGRLPRTVVIGVEPAQMNPWEISLTETVRSKLGEIINWTLEELEKAGGRYRRCGEEPTDDETSRRLSIVQEIPGPRSKADGPGEVAS